MTAEPAKAPRQMLPLPIAPDHPAFAGHFPGLPIVPGVVLLDEALHAIGAELGIDLSACQISSAKFLSPVPPDAAVSVSYEIVNHCSIRFEVTSLERTVATGIVRMPGLRISETG